MMNHNSISGNKTIAKNSFYLYVRMIILMLVSLITARVVLEALGVENYGIYSAVGGVVTSFTFLSQTLVSASQRFFSYCLGLDDKSELNKSYNAIIISYCVIAIIIVLVLETVGLWFVSNKMTIPAERMSQALYIYHFSIITFIFTLFTNPFNALIIAHEDMKVYAYMSFFEGFLKLGTAILLIYISLDKLELYGVLLCLISCIVLVFYWSICKKRYSYVYLNFRVSKDRIKDVLGYSSWTLFGTIAGVANNQGINVLLNVFIGPIANAAQAIAYQVSGVLNQVCNGFFSAVRPPITKNYAIGNIRECLFLFYFSNKILFLLLSIVVIPLYIEMEYVLNLWLGSVEQYMVSFSRLLLINTIILCISNPITTIIQAAGRVKLYHGVVDSFTLLVIPIICLFINVKEFPESVFFISNTIFAAAHYLRLLVLKRVIPFSIKDYFVKFINPSILVIAISFSVSYTIYMSLNVGFLRLLMVVFVSTLMLILSSVFILLSKSERMSLRHVLKVNILQRK